MMKLNKDNWKEYEMSELVSHLSSSERDEKKRHKALHLGVEHLKSLDLRLLKPDIDDKTSFTKIFNTGNILFARRAAYLKKIAIADFDGICSGDLMVLESNGELSQHLLAFMMQRDSFYKYVLSNSAGSLSLRIKWSALSKYKIKLPPKKEQEEILSLLITLDNQINKSKEQEQNLLNTKRQILRELFKTGNNFGKLKSDEDYSLISFNEIAENISKRIEPSKTDREIYVGLEHLDTDNLRIERNGVPSDVKGVKLLVNKGDIIFGKRRAYQRKVAVSHFDGICSAHSMVLRAKNHVIKNDFLPYFMQSDIFMNRAIQISEGSLSPTIKWKVLEKQQFNIPKIEYQNDLVDVFKHFDGLIDRLKEQFIVLQELKMKILTEIFD
jgi:restriction endonuclease S subunit